MRLPKILVLTCHQRRSPSGSARSCSTTPAANSSPVKRGRSGWPAPGASPALSGEGGCGGGRRYGRPAWAYAYAPRGGRTARRQVKRERPCLPQCVQIRFFLLPLRYPFVLTQDVGTKPGTYFLTGTARPVTPRYYPGNALASKYRFVLTSTRPAILCAMSCFAGSERGMLR